MRTTASAARRACACSRTTSRPCINTRKPASPRLRRAKSGVTRIANLSSRPPSRPAALRIPRRSTNSPTRATPGTRREPGIGRSSWARIRFAKPSKRWKRSGPRFRTITGDLAALLGTRFWATASRIPSNAARSPVIVRNLGPDLFHRFDGFANRILAQEERPIPGSRRVPGVARVGEFVERRGIRSAAGRDGGLLDKLAILVTPDFALLYHGEAGFRVLMHGLDVVLEHAQASRAADAVVRIAFTVVRDIAALHAIHDCPHVDLGENRRVRGGRRAVGGKREGGIAGRR